MQDRKKEIIASAIRTIQIEGEAILALADKINEDFALAVETILSSSGRVVVTGIGKSAIVGQKIVATLNSTGTPAIFMHAADAIHGDLGMIQETDQVLCISKSGNTPEIKALLPFFNRHQIIALVGNRESYLAQQADYVLDCSVKEEADPNNLAPTASSSAQLTLGDALAMALLHCRGFSSRDFAAFHPGGSLGKQLYLRAKDLIGNNASPRVRAEDTIREVIVEISSKRLGATAVCDSNHNVIGIITDGDLRRMMEAGKDITTLTARDITTSNPYSVQMEDMAVEALKIMRKNSITQLIVKKGERYQGIIHLHDLIAEGLI